LLRKAYNKQVLKLKKTINGADEEIIKLEILRQTLIEKNLAGIYSDEIFKEQNAIIEVKIKAAHSSKEDELITKYDIDKITAFLLDKLSNLADTYTTSNLSELRCLLSTIFLSGLTWGYPRYSNCKISPLYQDIRDAENNMFSFGEPPENRTQNLFLKRELLCQLS
jgi:hypothetical protein